MDSSSPKLLDPDFQRRGQLISALARWISIGLCLTALVFLWDSPHTRPRVAMAIGTGYLAVYLACRLWLRRRPRSRAAKVVHDVADALAVGLGAATSGGIESPVWLLLYPHVVAVSVRGGLGYALGFGVLDAAIVLGLTALTPTRPLGALHAVAIVFCAFMGGTTSAYLKQVQSRLRQANLDQAAANEQLQGTLRAHEAARAEQERTLQKLRESEERYRRMLERIQDGVVIVQDGRISYANRNFAQLLGATPEALVGTDFRELADPAARAELSERHRRWQQGLPSESTFETRLRAGEGSLRLVSVRVGRVELEGSGALVATVRDVTRQREMEREVKAHAERLAAINEIANAVNLNLTIEDILRVAAEEARRLVPFDRLTVALLDDEADSGQVVAAGGAGRTPFERASVAWAFKRPASACEGGSTPLPPATDTLLAQAGIRSLASVPLHSKDRLIGSLNFGRLEAAAFSAWDLGVLEPVARHIAIALDNARLLEAVRRRGREFQSLLEIGRGILERLEPAELLPLVARSVERVMGTQGCMLMLRHGDQLELAGHEGLEPQEVAALQRLTVGEGLTGWVAREGLPLAIDEIRDDPRVHAGVAERFGYRSYLCVPLMRGREVLGTLSVVSRTPRRFGPEPQELLEAFADQAAVAIENARLFEEARGNLTRVTEAKRRLEELDRMRQQYLRNVSHEFRTPLTVIKGYAEYLMDTGPLEPGALRDVMHVVTDSCDRVIDMVDTLLEVSRLEQGGEPVLAIASVDLVDVARGAAEALGRHAEKKGVQLVLELPGEPLSLEADLGLLQHLARKLVDNAVKYSAAGSAVVVRARRAGGALELEVEDAGIGIAAEHLPHIFEKFYMVDGGIARRVGGAGVGLYLVREIVRLHHGTVDVRSRPGHGSVFSVTLPTAPRDIPAPARA